MSHAQDYENLGVLPSTLLIVVSFVVAILPLVVQVAVLAS